MLLWCTEDTERCLTLHTFSLSFHQTQVVEIYVAFSESVEIFLSRKNEGTKIEILSHICTYSVVFVFVWRTPTNAMSTTISLCHIITVSCICKTVQMSEAKATELTLQHAYIYIYLEFMSSYICMDVYEYMDEFSVHFHINVSISSNTICSCRLYAYSFIFVVWIWDTQTANIHIHSHTHTFTVHHAYTHTDVFGTIQARL